MKTILKLIAAFALACALMNAGEPQGPKTVSVNSYGVLTAPTNFFDTNATAIATALAPWLGGGGLTNVTFLLHGATNALAPNALVLTAGANITLSTNGTELVITGEEGGGGSGTVTHTSGALTLDLPILGAGGDDIKSASASEFRTAVELVPGTDVEAWDADLDDLADGSLSGSKVGSGIDAANATTGLLDNARLSTSVTLDNEWDSSAEISTAVGSDKTGTGKLVFDTNPTLVGPYVGNLSNMQHNHDDGESGGQLGASALNPVDEYTFGIVHGNFGIYGSDVTGTNGVSDSLGNLRAGFTATATLIVDPINGDDETALRGRSDLPFKTLASAVAALENNDVMLLRPGTNSVTRPGMPVDSSLYSEHTNANFVLKNLTNVMVVGYGAVIKSTGLGNVLSIVDSENIHIEGVTFDGPGMNPIIAAQICGEIVLWGTNQNVRIARVGFEDYPNHGILVSQTEKTSYNTLVDGCWFLRGGTTNHATLTVDGAGVASTGPGLRVLGCSFNWVTRGVEIEGSGTLPKGPAVISGFGMTNILNQGIILLETSGIGTNLNDIVISDGTILMDKTAHTGQGQYGITASGGRNISVQNVTVTGANNAGFSFGTGQADLRRSGFRGCTAVSCGVSFAITDAGNRGIFDNYVDSCTAVASTTAQGGIVVAGSATRVTGNTVADSAGYGVYVIPNGNGTAGTTNVWVQGNLIRTPEYHAIGVAAGSVDTVVWGNNLEYAANKFSDGGTGTKYQELDELTVLGHVAAGTMGTTNNPSIDDALDDKMASDKTFAVGEITGWDALPAFGVGYVPTFDVATVTNTFDLSWAGKPVVDVIVSNALQITDSDRLTATNKTKFPVLRLRSFVATECALIWPEDWVSASGVYPLTIKPYETLRVYPEWTFGRVEFGWTGDQSRPLGVAPGGTGNSRGVAAAPIWTRYTPAVVNVTNWPVELLSGTRVIENFNTNLNIYAVSGAPTDSTEVLGQVWTLRNTNTVVANSNKITWVAGINAVGFDTNYLWVPTNGYARLEFEVSSDATNLINRFATTTTLSGGTGSTTPSTLTNGLMAYYNFEEATDTTLEDQTANNRDMTPNSGAHFTPQFTGGTANYSWTNSSIAGYLGRSSADIEPQSTGVRTYSFTFRAASLSDYDTIIGQTGASGNESWFLYRFSGTLRLRVSTDGTADSGYDSGVAVATSTTYHCVLEIDQDTNIAKLWVNNTAGNNMSYGSDLYNSSADFTLFGRTANDTVGLRGVMDDVGIWNRALTSTERDQLYDILTAGGDTYAALDDAL